MTLDTFFLLNSVKAHNMVLLVMTICNLVESFDASVYIAHSFCITWSMLANISQTTFIFRIRI